ncbi:hypothetical protein HMPREF9129_2198 [Peptoniphilus indolicus ATCC 29427]|uniref:Uncharacterized protein n=1 Tax=Peptoniphilus indolicus ATCC 29427 TaxID=997350 RepID=G4D718_9FIRM|nr:hypothetical protein HMPREF9129_2198 [Peptoniphilus indolicus ATCC 29427]
MPSLSTSLIFKVYFVCPGFSFCFLSSNLLASSTILPISSLSLDPSINFFAKFFDLSVISFNSSISFLAFSFRSFNFLSSNPLDSATIFSTSALSLALSINFFAKFFDLSVIVFNFSISFLAFSFNSISLALSFSTANSKAILTELIVVDVLTPLINASFSLSLKYPRLLIFLANLTFVNSTLKSFISLSIFSISIFRLFNCSSLVS